MSTLAWNPALAAMQAYQVPDAQGMIKLDAMENPYPLPEPVAKAFAAKVADCATNRYPDAAARPLKAQIQRVFPVDDGCGCVLGNGSDELIAMLMQAILAPGATVLAVEPSFVMYRHLAQVLGLKFVGVPLGADFSLDMPAVQAAIVEHQPQLIFIASPNNPTGNLFPVEQLDELARQAPGLFVLDEAYIPYARRDGAGLLAAHPHLVLLRTLSKWGLAGLRLGFAQARADICAQLEKVRMPYNINVLSQELGALCLQHDAEFQVQIDALIDGRAVLQQGLQAPGVEVFPSAANFVLVRVRDANRAHAALQAHRILVKKLHGSHPLLEGCLRISIGTPAENQALLACWAECVQA